VLAVEFVIRRWGEYAFVRPGREMLFSRVDHETKYKAKNLIDVPVYRGGDALSAQVKAGLESGGLSTAGVALLGAGLAAAWALNGWWLGRRQEGKAPAAPGAAAGSRARSTAPRSLPARGSTPSGRTGGLDPAQRATWP
jgi:AAA family ATP:ADP antiporter